MHMFHEQDKDNTAAILIRYLPVEYWFVQGALAPALTASGCTSPLLSTTSITT